MKTKAKGKLLAILMSLAVVFTMTPVISQPAHAWSTVTIGYLEYILEDDGTAGVGGYTDEMPADVTVPAEIVSEGETYAVVGIEGDAFQNCANLTSITIPNSVTSIGDGAFKNSGLTSVTIPASVTSIEGGAFFHCESLSSVTFAEGSELESIGEEAFKGTSITSITIPEKVTSIGDRAFAYCHSLSSVTFAEGSELKIIGGEAFESTNIRSVTIPESVTSIGGAAFRESAITSITIPASVTSIEGSAFRKCQSLSSVTFAEGSELKSIGSGAFRETAITSITIPTSVTSIGSGAFNFNEGHPVFYMGTKTQWDEMSGRASDWAGGNTDQVRVFFVIKEPEGKSFTYNGETHTGVNEGEGYTLYGTTFATNAGLYMVTATLNDGYVWSDGSTDPIEIEWKIDKAIAEDKVAIPESRNFTYNGKEQTGVSEGANYILSGTAKASNAGTYKATATLNEDDNYIYKWSGGSTDPIEIEWKIDKATAKVTAPAGKKLTYNGKTQTGVAAGANYTLSGTVKATKAGTYKATATLNEDDNYIYKWSDGSTDPIEIEWKIDKATAKVTAPAGKKLTYNGKTQTGVAAGANYTLSGTVKATKAGTYTAKATLKTNANYTYKWSDGTTAPKTIKWTINKAANPLTVKGRTATVKYSAVKKKAQVLAVGKVIAFTKKGQGKLTYTKASGNKKITINKTTGKVTVMKGLKKGTYKVKIKVKAAGNANYKASAVYTVTFKIKVR